MSRVGGQCRSLLLKVVVLVVGLLQAGLRMTENRVAHVLTESEARQPRLAGNPKIVDAIGLQAGGLVAHCGPQLPLRHLVDAQLGL